jgi:hypothetical protein
MQDDFIELLQEPRPSCYAARTMKRRAPTIWAAVVVLGVAGLAYRDGNLRKAAVRDSGETLPSPPSESMDNVQAEKTAEPSAVEGPAPPDPS